MKGYDLYRFLLFTGLLCAGTLRCSLSGESTSPIGSTSTVHRDGTGSADVDINSVPDNNDDPHVLYFSDTSSRLSFTGGTASTAVKGHAEFSKLALKIIFPEQPLCELSKIELLDHRKALVRNLILNPVSEMGCNNDSLFMQTVRILMEKSFRSNEDIVLLEKTEENKLYIYFSDSRISNLLLNRHALRIHNKKGRYVTRNLQGAVDGPPSIKASLHFYIKEGLVKNAKDRKISIDGVSIGLGSQALSAEEVAEKIADSDFTGGKIYKEIPYTVSFQENKVTFSAKLPGDKSNGKNLSIEDNQYTASPSE